MDASFANKVTIFLWFLALTFCPSAWVEAGCSEEQNRALLEIRNSSHGLAFADFDGSADCCSTCNIVCDGDGKVTNLINLCMTTPSITWYPNVTLFTLFNELKVLDLSSMNIGGELQAFCELKRLKYLRELYLGNNTLEGNIPSCLERFENLEILKLSDNRLQGNLPSSIFSNQSKITSCEVSGNRLEGVLSFSILANASSLYYLDLSNNELEIETESPSWVPTFQLSALLLKNCSLNKKNGHVVPTFISTQYLLSLLDLSDNSLEGSVPCHLFFNMNITVLYLSGNKIDGSFHDCSANGTSPLELLDISDNHVKGSLPENIGYLLPCLYVADLSHNMLSGTVPSSLSRSGTQLILLDLSNNKLQGQMLPKDANMAQLTILHLSGNHFEGVISPTISNSPYLEILDVGDNDLSGNIPEWLYDHSSLVALNLSGNRFEGHLHRRLCRMKKLQVFDVSHNRLSGGIPSCLDNITFWNNSSTRQASYYIPPFLKPEAQMPWFIKNEYRTFFTSLPLLLMTGIDLSSNQLTGRIPFEMGELSQLQFLNLSNNSLTGSIPISFRNLRSMESLDLSHNKLRGRIPSELVELTNLSVFSVAYNNLSGRIPFGYQFSTFTSQCYEGNPELCGVLLQRNCSTAPEEKEGTRMIDHPFFFSLFVTVSYALGFWAFFGILIIKKNWRHKYFRAVDGYIEFLFELLFKYK